jgi:hypothetical protein
MAQHLLAQRVRQRLPSLGVADDTARLPAAPCPPAASPCTSAPAYRTALAEAVFVELPLAGAAFWLAARLARGAHGGPRSPRRRAAG